MAEFTFGRVNLSTGSGGDGIDNLRLAAYERSGSTLTLTGYIRPLDFSVQATIDVSNVRGQMLGYDDNPDEPVIPITWSRDPSVDGFYRVRSVDVGSEARQRMARGLTYPFKAVVESVPDGGFSVGRVEYRLSGDVRVNSHSITSASASGWHAVNSESFPTYYEANSGVDTANALTVTTRSDAGGSPVYVLTTASTTLFIPEALPTTNSPPATFYIGSARVSVGTPATSTTSAALNTAFASYRSVIGHRIGITSSGILLDNGFTRFFKSPPNDTANSWTIGAFDGTGWDYKEFFLAFTPVGRASVIRNSLTAATLRFFPGPGSGVSFQYLDATLRRGSRMVELQMAANATSVNAQLGPFINEAATSLTGGWRATSNDASLNRYVIAVPGPISLTTATGQANVTIGGRLLRFGFGLEVMGTGSKTQDGAQNIVYQYMAAQNETQRVVVP